MAESCDVESKRYIPGGGGGVGWWGWGEAELFTCLYPSRVSGREERVLL